MEKAKYVMDTVISTLPIHDRKKKINKSLLSLFVRMIDENDDDSREKKITKAIRH